MSQSVTFKGTSRELKKILIGLPALISGKKPDTQGLGRRFKHITGFYLFQQIEEAFLAKSWGGTDNLGIVWKPLARSTIANRPLVRGDVKKYKLPRNRTRGLLTPAQDLLWRRTFSTNLRRLSSRMGETAARILAAKIAWSVVKAAGARTKLEVLGSRRVQMLVVSERLIDSIQAGDLSDGNYTPPPEQIFQTGLNEIRIGSKVPYFAKQNKQRTIIPSATRIAPWLRTATRKAVQDFLPLLAASIRK